MHFLIYQAQTLFAKQKEKNDSALFHPKHFFIGFQYKRELTLRLINHSFEPPYTVIPCLMGSAHTHLRSTSLDEFIFYLGFSSPSQSFYFSKPRSIH
jgi:hypothetical protein